MTLFVDASALVAIIESEPGHLELLARLETPSRRLWSAMSGWQTVSALRSSYARSIDVARERMASYVDALDLEMVGIGPTELATALDAYQRYGKGRHRARLNFGDCFAYACAKTNNARLLYRGDDFAQTDLA